MRGGRVRGGGRGRQKALAKKGVHGTLARESFIGGSYDLSQTNQSHAGRTHSHSRPYGTFDLKNVAKKKVDPHCH